MTLDNLIFEPEFILAIIFSFIISYVIAYIVQDTWDMYLSLCLEEANFNLEFVSITDDELSIGCRVYDNFTEIVGYYCGEALLEDNNSYAVVVVSLGNKIHYYHALPETLNVVDL